MTRLHGHNFQENHRTREMHLSEKLVATQVTANHTMKVVTSQAAHSLPAMQATTGSAIKVVVAHTPPVNEAVPLVREAADQTMNIVRHAAAPAVEAMSTPEGRKKVGKVALHVADHIIDEASRPYTCGIPVYRYTKEAIIYANESRNNAEKEKS